ncbi:MAG: hypothetical protein N3E51_00105 [Candidatus Micrarchaeota archaeon]|nr:hypothetical protein [Candidatus Micrarchaeota archaeon]
MCRQRHTSQSKRAFFSADAAFALLCAVIAYSLFALLLSASADSASRAAQDCSKSSLAIRLSSHLLEERWAVLGGQWGGSFVSRGELDLNRISSQDLESLRTRLGLKFASARITGAQGEIFSAESGQKGAQVFCASRIGIAFQKPVLVEVCVS